jgi:acetylglutamate/LysW-gamma-L-alpha-aminoadipate kinase
MSSVMVVKCGGNSAVEPDEVCRDVAALRHAGQQIVLVHGGSADIERLSRRLRIPLRRMTTDAGVTTRYTDPATLEVVVLALVGLVKPRLVSGLEAGGVRAVGLTGCDGGLLRARRYGPIRATVDGRRMVVRDNQSGRIVGVNSTLLWTLLGAGIVPVVSPPALAEDSAPVNADADRVAAAIAVALGAPTLVLLTAAAGVLRDPDDEASVLDELPIVGGPPPPFARGGMAMKLVAAEEAVTGGVNRVLIADGRRPEPLSRALAGAGTRVTAAP